MAYAYFPKIWKVALCKCSSRLDIVNYDGVYYRLQQLKKFRMYTFQQFKRHNF